MLTATDLPALHPWRCGNPSCGSRRGGEGQIVMRGPNVVGWVGEGRCHQCGYLTLIRITADGVEYSVRPAKNNANGR